MRTIRYTNRFKKDVQRMQKQGKDFTLFRQVIEWLAAEDELPLRFKSIRWMGRVKAATLAPTG